VKSCRPDMVGGEGDGGGKDSNAPLVAGDACLQERYFHQ